MIIDYTRQLLRKHRLGDGRKAMRTRFGNDQMIQLTGAIGYYACWR